MIEDNLLQDIIQWDVKSWSKALFFWEKKVDWNKVHICLELGGREGGLSLWLASKGKKVICSDLKDVKKTAEHLHQKYNLGELVSYHDIDATNIPFENYFDVIIFKSIIGGIGIGNNIDIQNKVFTQIHKALKPGGQLLFAENLIASPLHQCFRKNFTNWGSAWRYISKDEMKLFLSVFSYFEMYSNGLLASFGRNERQRNLFAKFDNLISNKVFPEKWNYICYGVAKK
jgi:SAM-dependent methyltransferase